MYYNFEIESDLPWEYVAPVMGAIILFSLMISLVFHIFYSIGIYTLAKRRGIRNPGVAWLPIGNSWILGCLADQYDNVTRAKQSKQRHILLWLSLGSVLVYLFLIGILLASFFPVWEEMINGNYYGGTTPVLFSNMLLLLAAYFLLMGVSVTYSVFQYIILYKIYKSCTPDTAVAFLLVSIFISLAMPFLVFAVRNKDLGMVPLYAPQDGNTQ